MAEKRQRLGLIIAGLLLGLFISAMDNTIVSTAMGTIVAQLGGLDKFVWVTSAYMVTEMAGMPIFGKLSDMYGRKRFFMFGLVVFLLGSILCGTAHSIVQLAIYRAIQGIGGGALAPIAFTIIFDVVPPDKAGKFSGMFGAVFGMSSIIGPLLGSYITDNMSWRWVFYINVPLGIVTFLLILLSYHESPRHTRQRIDWLGALTLVPAVVCLMFGLEFGGNKYAWDAPQILVLFGAAAVLFAAFFVVEARAQEPIISYSMFRHRLFAGSTLVGLFSSAAFVVAVVYIPIFVQGVLGGSATNSGLILLPMMLGSSVSAPIGGQLASRFRYRTIMFWSSLVFIAAIYLLSTVTPNTSRTTLTLYMVLVGLGIGPSFSVLGMAGMHHFHAGQRGAASSTMSFVRELGMTVGITVFGMIQRNLFTHDLKQAFQDMGNVVARFQGADPHAMLSPATRTQIPGPILTKLSEALSSSVAHTFLWTLVLAVLSFGFVFWLGREKWQGFAQMPKEAPVVHE
ncbi:MDR family MFS transporter [Alicyclobacillus contaminans]|uniref:MDR family MFS transporter n=1 Tax=Alicyclobacillus contaminans TaxID=392016 RepID=UPI0003FF2B55|nr:MDR family MFS transporter [Alicyclobacillus contaminans]